MNNDQEIKNSVIEKYGALARQSTKIIQSSCCGSGCECSSIEYPKVSEDYTSLPGYIPDADLALGCGLPTEYAFIKPGDTVIDLGSGAGNDCFIARSKIGSTGRVIGIDMTMEMIDKAKMNLQNLGFSNVQFYHGDIENIPLDDNIADVIVSNCVINLVPNKQQVFSEVFRLLKHGGHFSISDIVLHGTLSEDLRRVAILYTGCISGAIQKTEYLQIIEQAGFINIQVQKDRKAKIPESLLEQVLSNNQLKEFRNKPILLSSITVYGEKP